jgi:Family of unknown function (DUF5677)
VPRSQVLSHLGPYLKHLHVAEFSSISDRAYDLYSEASGGNEHGKETPTQHLAIRMMYIAHATSIALRINSSWALTHPALSLLRDRYEQVVRFSWLARQSDNVEIAKFLASYYAKSIKLHQSMTDQQRAEFDKLIRTSPDWLKENPTKAQSQYLNSWNSVDLLSLAKKRDMLPPLSPCKLGRAALADLYNSIYAHFSSVTHYDMYSMNILGFHRSPTGQYILAADPAFSQIIFLNCALFDLIQCYEGARCYFAADLDERFDALLAELNELTKLAIGPTDASEAPPADQQDSTPR